MSSAVLGLVQALLDFSTLVCGDLLRDLHLGRGPTTLLHAALASVPFRFVLARVRVRGPFENAEARASLHTPNNLPTRTTRLEFQRFSVLDFVQEMSLVSFFMGSILLGLA